MKWENTINGLLAVVEALFVVFIIYQVVWQERPPAEDPWASEQGFIQNASALPYNGMDISQEQGYVDWQSVSMDHLIDFVYLKATEGDSHVDSRYMANVRAAYNFGFLVGSFHRLTAESSIVNQFFNFKKNVDHGAQQLLPMVEIDERSTKGWTQQQIQDSLALFTWLVNDFYGSFPIIKTSQEFYEKRLYPRFEDMPLFIMDASESQPEVNSKFFYMWRRTREGDIPGIIFDVNLDSFTFGTSLNDIFLI